jgi:anthranilate phosphoribosyltransferase
MTTGPAGGASGPSWPGLLSSLLRGEDLVAAETSWAMEQVMLGEATPVQLAGFVVALRAKGESPEEVAGLVSTMLAHAQQIDVPGPIVDTCGTGGDRAHTVNISTMAAMVVAGDRCAGGQARQPGGLVVLRLGRPARGARRRGRPRPAAGGRVREESRHRVLLRAPASTRRCGTPPQPAAGSASRRSSTSSVR